MSWGSNVTVFQTHRTETQTAQVLYSSSWGKAAKDLFLFARFSCRIFTRLLGFRSLFNVLKKGDELHWASSAVSNERQGPPEGKSDLWACLVFSSGFCSVPPKPHSSQQSTLREIFTPLHSGPSLRARCDSVHVNVQWNRPFTVLPLMKKPSAAVINFWRCFVMLAKWRVTIT